jgi:outer membrane immunogenic protein
MILGAALAAGWATSAFAADLPMRSAPSMLSPVPVYNWTGFYGGLNGGYAWGSQNPLGLLAPQFGQTNSFSLSGGMFGGTIGGQIQAGHVVLGIEGDADWTGLSGSKTLPISITGLAYPFHLSSNTTGLMTARSRVGYASDNWLFYATAGAALLNGNAKGSGVGGVDCGIGTLVPSCSNSQLRPGAAAGLGVEYGFAPNWTAKLEYIWAGAVAGAATESVNTIRAGVNYRFAD